MGFFFLNLIRVNSNGMWDIPLWSYINRVVDSLPLKFQQTLINYSLIAWFAGVSQFCFGKLGQTSTIPCMKLLFQLNNYE